MNNQELEQEILSFIPYSPSGMTKSALHRLIRTDRSSMLKAVSHLTDLGYIRQETKGNTHLLSLIDTKSDIKTFKGVMKWQIDLLSESIKKLNEHKKLFKFREYKKKPNEYKPINPKIAQDLMQFSMYVDYLMQHSNKYHYAKQFKFMTEKEANFRINKIDRILKKSIDQVFTKHSKERLGLIYWIQHTDRTWNVII